MTSSDKAAVAAKPLAPVAKKVAKPTAKPKAAVTAKPSANQTAKAKAKPAPKAVAKPSVAKPTVAKPVKVKKPKMVRDSFTFPKAEYAVLDELKLRSAKLGHPIKKTELLRAGIKAIAAMQDSALLAALKAVPSLKTGRPAGSK